MRLVLKCFATASAVVMLTACYKDWTDRDLAPVAVNLGDRGTVTISLPNGLKRSTADGPLAIFESEANDGPSVYLTSFSWAENDSADAYIAANKDGQSFQKHDVPDGFAVSFDSDGPHVHVQRKSGKNFIVCDAWFSGTDKTRAKREDMILRICSSVK